MINLPRLSRLRKVERASAERVGRLFPSLLLLAFAGLAVPAASAQPAKASGLVISKAWMRFIIPGRPAAGYFVLSNTSNQNRSLIGASSPACKSVMLHESVQKNGVEKMVMVKSVAVPAHGGAAFAPGGYHLMCMSPTRAVRVGAKVLMTLVFADGTKLKAGFIVKGAAATKY